jgi:predicted RNase H-like HicB family nuclease
LQSNKVIGNIALGRMKANVKGKRAVATEITLIIERDEESGWLVASWDALRNQGGITRQGKTLRELEQNVRDAIACHFENREQPRRIHLLASP